MRVMNELYTRYYHNQSGKNVQNLGNIYHAPRVVQHGRGIGSLFTALFSHLKPILRTGANFLKNKSIEIGKEILEEVGTKPIKQILKEKGKKIVNNVRENTLEKLKSMQKGEGKRIKLKRLKQKSQTKSKRCKAKNVKDIFGSWKCRGS